MWVGEQSPESQGVSGKAAPRRVTLRLDQGSYAAVARLALERYPSQEGRRVAPALLGVLRRARIPGPEVLRGVYRILERRRSEQGELHAAVQCPPEVVEAIERHALPSELGFDAVCEAIVMADLLRHERVATQKRPVAAPRVETEEASQRKPKDGPGGWQTRCADDEGEWRDGGWR